MRKKCVFISRTFEYKNPNEYLMKPSKLLEFLIELNKLIEEKF